MKADVSYSDFKGSIGADIFRYISGNAGETLESIGNFKLDENKFHINGLSFIEMQIFP